MDAGISAIDLAGDALVVADIDGHLRALRSATDVREVASTDHVIQWMRVSKGARRLATVGSDGAVRIFSLPSLTRLATLNELVDGRWLVVAPDGHFTGSDGVEAALRWIDPKTWSLVDDVTLAAKMRDVDRVKATIAAEGT